MPWNRENLVGSPGSILPCKEPKAMPVVVVFTRWTNKRIKEYAIEVSTGRYLCDAHGRILRYSQKAAAIDRLKLL